MLETYFDSAAKTPEEAIELNQRLLAVQAALEIAKASASAPTAYAGVRTGVDLREIAAGINSLADAIQSALNKK
ncbi:hypothetical protein [Dickeya sp. ws52]|uniref:hypothetical protein n=1 Tax=Dickeya sp. ws52 TaxID=2576377 RepID=UPI00117F93CD|nr:hypothetical protein [Dickeya sp. ws52]TYL43899.1 hypothetical protein FDP13_03590 [Dickeya sp. ws52]